MMPDSRPLILEAPEIVQLSSWMAGFNRDLPTRVLTALSAERGIVLVSSSGPVSAELHAAVTERLRAADLVTVPMTAPLGPLAALHDAICDAIPVARSLGQPLVVLIENAQALTGEELRRLHALTTLRSTGQLVLHAVLIATPSVLPVLRQAGLEGVWDDATAHIRLVSDLAACLPEPAAPPVPARQKTWLPPPRLTSVSDARTARWHIPPRPGGRALGSALGGLILAAYAGAWAFLAPDPVAPFQASTIVTGASIQPLSRPAVAQPLVLRPAFLVAPIRAARPAAELSPAAEILPLHVTLFYRDGDQAAAARAKRLLSRLRGEGILADGPSPAAGAASRLSYVFPQDHAAAEDLARRFGLGAPVPGESRTGSAALARPGEISIFIGSRDRVDADAQSGGST